MTGAVVSSRRVSAGIVPAAGATSRLTSWWGADDWLQEIEDALSPEVLRDHHVARETLLKVARCHATYADHRTGRGCRPTNERLVEEAQASLSTVQRARRALKALGFVVELVRGRSIMTYAERMEAWRRGSSHRQVAAEFALCSRRRSAPRRRPSEVGLGGNDLGAGPHPVDGDTPPGAKIVTSQSHLRRSSLRRRTTETRKPLRGAHTEVSDGRPAAGGQAARRLAEAVQRRVGWLRGVPAGRMAPTLSKFARAGWGASDVELGIRDALGSRGWKVPAALTTPAAYLATLLRELDPADRPGAIEDQLRADEAAERHFHDHLRVYGPRCPHGEPAGNVPTPLRGLILCPGCRRGSSTS